MQLTAGQSRGFSMSDNEAETDMQAEAFTHTEIVLQGRRRFLLLEFTCV